MKLLIGRDMKKKDLQTLSGTNASSVAKLGRNETVTTQVLKKICIALNCELSNIAEIHNDRREGAGE